MLRRVVVGTVNSLTKDLKPEAQHLGDSKYGRYVATLTRAVIMRERRDGTVVVGNGVIAITSARGIYACRR